MSDQRFAKAVPPKGVFAVHTLPKPGCLLLAINVNCQHLNCLLSVSISASALASGSVTTFTLLAANTDLQRVGTSIDPAPELVAGAVQTGVSDDRLNPPDSNKHRGAAG